MRCDFLKLFFIHEQDICLVVYTKDKAAKCRGPALELLIKVSKGNYAQNIKPFVLLLYFDPCLKYICLKITFRFVCFTNIT